jgi:hypothetical protein
MSEEICGKRVAQVKTRHRSLTFDFTLSEGVTNYVISVHFNESGQVGEITMES